MSVCIECGKIMCGVVPVCSECRYWGRGDCIDTWDVPTIWYWIVKEQKERKRGLNREFHFAKVLLTPVNNKQ